MAPIAISKYTLANNGIGTIIYPQLRSASNPGKTVWDGRKIRGFRYEIFIGGLVTATLGEENMPQNTPFFLSSNVVFGYDAWNAGIQFVFDPNSNVEATASFYGATLSGYLVFNGTKTSSLGDEVKMDILHSWKVEDEQSASLGARSDSDSGWEDIEGVGR